MIETINKINRVSRQLLRWGVNQPEEWGERLEMDEVKVRKVLKVPKSHFHGNLIGDDEDSFQETSLDKTISSPVEDATSAGLQERLVMCLATSPSEKPCRYVSVLICQPITRLKKWANSLM